MPELANPIIETALRGSVLVLLQFDVAEAIRLDRLQELIRARTVQQPSLKHPAPGYVRYQRPPVVEPLETLELESGERLQGEIKYYDYGVVSLIYELPFKQAHPAGQPLGVGGGFCRAGHGHRPRQSGARGAGDAQAL